MGDGRWSRAQADARYRGFLRHDRCYGVRIDLHAGLLRHLSVARCPRPEGDNRLGGAFGAGRMNQLNLLRSWNARDSICRAERLRRGRRAPKPVSEAGMTAEELAKS